MQTTLLSSAFLYVQTYPMTPSQTIIQEFAWMFACLDLSAWLPLSIVWEVVGGLSMLTLSLVAVLTSVLWDTFHKMLQLHAELLVHL